jgi:hypothetical protein
MGPDELKMVMEVFGGMDNLRAMAAAWKRSNMSSTSASLRPQHPFASTAGVRHEAAALWIRLTRILHASRNLPFGDRGPSGYLHRGTLERMLFLPGCTDWGRSARCIDKAVGPRHSIQREILNRWHRRESAALVPSNARCVETVRGHPCLIHIDSLRDRTCMRASCILVMLRAMVISLVG